MRIKPSCSFFRVKKTWPPGVNNTSEAEKNGSDLSIPRIGELRTQKLKSHLVRTQSLNVLPLKPGVGQYVAIHATLTARDFFPAYFYPSAFFPQTLSRFFLCWLWLKHGSCVDPQNKIGHEQVPVLNARRNINRLKKNNPQKNPSTT